MSASESVVIVPDLLISLLFAPLLTIIGLLTEQAALADLAAGVSPFAVWELYMGLLLLYAGAYILGYRTLVPAISGQG